MKRKNVLKYTKGFYGRSKNCNKLAKQALARARQNSYRSRKLKKRNMKRLWNMRINSGLRNMTEGFTYSQFIGVLRKKSGDGTVGINRKMLCKMPIDIFESYVRQVMKN